MTDEPTTGNPDPQPPAAPIAEPRPDASPFSLPPLETEGHDDGVVPAESPFEIPPVEGIPYEKGGEEDRAVRAVIEEAERERVGRSRVSST